MFNIDELVNLNWVRRLDVEDLKEISWYLHHHINNEEPATYRILEDEIYITRVKDDEYGYKFYKKNFEKERAYVKRKHEVWK